MDPCCWARIASGLELNVTLPSGSGGSVAVPKTFGASSAISETGLPVWAAGAFVPGVAGVLAATEEADFIVFSITSGAFLFRTASA